MSAQPYKPVTWGDEPASKDKMQQMANNEQWLYGNSPRMLYAAASIKKTSGLKILAGTAWIPATSLYYANVPVYFGSFFSTGCSPVVVMTPNPRNWQNRFTFSCRGIGTLQPDYRGFTAQVTVNESSAGW